MAVNCCKVPPAIVWSDGVTERDSRGERVRTVDPATVPSLAVMVVDAGNPVLAAVTSPVPLTVATEGSLDSQVTEFDRLAVALFE
jgi:hypothetical protein